METINQKIQNEIANAIRNVRFGSVEITIHNSQVVQIEQKNKVRFDSKTRPLDNQ